MRATISLLGAALLLIIFVACPPPERDDALAAGLITEADTTRCATTEDIYHNHGSAAKELHARVKNDCTGLDTIPPYAQARIWVRDSLGNVVDNQDASVDYQSTHRGTFLVPGGATLRLECPADFTRDGGCRWLYRYAIR